MQRIELTQRFRGTLLSSALAAAFALAGGYAHAGDDTGKKPYAAEQPTEASVNVQASVVSADRERMMEMQRALAARNLYQGAIDGVDGPKTQAALRNFQTQRGLPATGALTASTAEALGMEPQRQAVAGTDTPPTGKVQKQ